MDVGVFIFVGVVVGGGGVIILVLVRLTLPHLGLLIKFAAEFIGESLLVGYVYGKLFVLYYG